MNTNDENLGALQERARGGDTVARFRDAMRLKEYHLYPGNSEKEYWAFCPGHESFGMHYPTLHVNLVVDATGAPDVVTWCEKCKDTWFEDIMLGDVDKCTTLWHPRKGSTGTHTSGHGSRMSQWEIQDEYGYAKWCAQVAREDDARNPFPYEVAYFNYGKAKEWRKVKWSDKQFIWLLKLDKNTDDDIYIAGLYGTTEAIPMYGSESIDPSVEEIWLVEGEKDVEILKKWGICAVNYQVPGNWRAKLEFLKGRRVVLLGDNDTDGRANVEKVRDALVVQRGCRDLRVLGFFGDVKGYDVSDWVRDGGTKAELLELAQRAEVVVVCEEAAAAGETEEAEPAPEVAAEPAPEVDPRFARDVLKRVRNMKVDRVARQKLNESVWTIPDADGDFSLAEAVGKEFPSREFYIEKILAHRHIVTITGQAKTGKTTLTGNLVRSLVDGVPFLGKLEAVRLEAGRVGMWNCEMDPQDYAEYLLGMGIRNNAAIQIRNLRGYNVNLLTDEGMDWTVRWLNQHDIEIWIPDPWTKLMGWTGLSEDKNSEVQQVQIRIAEIQRLTDVRTVIIPTHPSKAEGKESEEPSTRGAQVMEDWPDALWKYVKTQDAGKTRSLYVYGRGVDMAATALHFDSDTNGLKVDSAIGISPQKVVDFELKDNVMAIIGREPGIIQSEIKRQINKRPEAVIAALKELEAASKIRRDQEETGRRTVRYYLEQELPAWPNAGVGGDSPTESDWGEG